MDESVYQFKMVSTPVGQLKLVASAKGLAAVLWETDSPGRVRLPESSVCVGNQILVEAERQLDEYFAGVRRNFRIPLEFRGTEFQTKVWRTLTSIPCGATRTYTQIAAEVGQPAAVRAVGAANGKNPIAIIVPCHRVIGADGSMTGFAGGVRIKVQLLEHEARYCNRFAPV